MRSVRANVIARIRTFRLPRRTSTQEEPKLSDSEQRNLRPATAAYFQIVKLDQQIEGRFRILIAIRNVKPIAPIVDCYRGQVPGTYFGNMYLQKVVGHLPPVKRLTELIQRLRNKPLLDVAPRYFDSL